MKKLLPLALCLVLLLCACARAESLTGKAKGYGGDITVAVTRDGGKIVSISFEEENETPEIGGKALDTMAQEILAKGSTDVDIVSGATITSKAVIAAVNNALDPAKYPYGGAAAASPAAAANADTYLGFGISTAGRIGPGEDAEGVPVYSINEVFASALFDKEGRVLGLYVDQLEVATPNYDGAGMPVFSGFPGQGGYNWDKEHNGTIAGKTPDTEENYQKEIEGWKTKRQRGDTYKMTSGTWASEMDTYQRIFVGKTVAEIETWVKTYCSDTNNKPLVAGSDKAEDAAKYDKLSDADKQMLADVTSSATMSLNDAHGNIVAAIRSAYDNRVPVAATAEAAPGKAAASPAATAAAPKATAGATPAAESGASPAASAAAGK